MRITIPKKSINPHLLMTKAGYHVHPNGKSYVMRLGRNNFPRFHAYFKINKKNELILNLHLDQSPAVHKWKTKAHAGEYKSELVKKEIGRLQRWIKHFSAQKWLISINKK